MSDPITMLQVQRDPTADDKGQNDQIIAGDGQDYPGSMVLPGVAWHNTQTGGVFLRVGPGPPRMIQVVSIDPATDFDAEDNYVPQNGHVWRNTATGSLSIRVDGEWVRVVADIPAGPYERA